MVSRIYFLSFFVVVLSYNCKFNFKFSRVCHFYRYDERCFSGQTQFCKVLLTKKDELKCPHFVCSKVSSISNNSSPIFVNQTDNSKQIVEVVKTLDKGSQNISKTTTLRKQINSNSSLISKKSERELLNILKSSNSQKFKNKTIDAKKLISKTQTRVSKTETKNNLVRSDSAKTTKSLLKNITATPFLKSSANKTEAIQFEQFITKSNHLLKEKFVNTSKSFPLIPQDNSSEINVILEQSSIKNLSSEVKYLPRNSKPNSYFLKNNITRNFFQKHTKPNTFQNHTSLKLKTFVPKNNSLSLKKFKTKFETNETLNSERLYFEDKIHWEEVSKLINFSDHQKSLKEQAKNITFAKLSHKFEAFESSKNETPKIKSVRSKRIMEVSCPTETCVLEFREQPVVRKRFFLLFCVIVKY
jgi:ligand-binding sensor protein